MRLRVGLPLAAALAALPLLTDDPYWLHVLITAALNAGLALSLRVLWNVGLLSCGHAALAGVGAYASALLATRAGISPWIGLLAAIVASAVVALGLGALTLRLRGIYFVLVTFAFNEVFFLVLNRWRDFTGGPSGIVGVPRFDGLPPGRVAAYELALVLLAATVVALGVLERSRVGAIWFALRDSELRARAVGINVMAYRLGAFVASAAVAGAWGAYHAHYVTVIAPTDFTIWQSIYVQIYMIVGGAGTFAGPLAGAAAITILTELIRATGPLVTVIYGVVLVAVMLFLPGGLAALAGRRTPWRRFSKSTA